MEMDPWVVSDVLRPNLEWTGFLDNSIIHTVRVETYLERTKDNSFDYISVTPPYMLVDYEILMKQISESSVIGDDSFIVSHFVILTLSLYFCTFGLLRYFIIRNHSIGRGVSISNRHA